MKTLLWLYAVTGFMFDIANLLLKNVFHLNNHLTSNLFVLIEFLLISYYYKGRLLAGSMPAALLIPALGLAFVAHTAIRSIFDFNSLGYSFFCFIYIIFSILGFYSLLKNAEMIYIEQSGFFWVNVAFILYASGSFLLLLFRYYMQQHDLQLFDTLWGTSFLSLNILKYLFLAVALSKKAVIEPY